MPNLLHAPTLEMNLEGMIIVGPIRFACSLFFSAHMREAQKSGVADTVDHQVPTNEEVDRDMQLLTKQQEKLMNELKKAYQDEAERSRELEDDAKRAEMEERLRAMNLHFSPKNEEDLKGLKTVCFFLK